MEPLAATGGILGLAVVLAVAIGAYGRVRLERERTLQRLVDRGLTVDELARILGPDVQRRLDLRRGVLLLAVAAAWSAVTFAIGGRAWTLGAVPAAIGLAYVTVWGVHGRQR